MANDPEIDLGETFAKVVKFDAPLLRLLKAERKARRLPSLSSCIRVLLRERLVDAARGKA